MMVSGSVDGFSESDKSSLQAKVATTAGVETSLVAILVAAASVRITATIAIPASTTPDAVNVTLTSRLGTVAAASAVLAVALEEVPIISIIMLGGPIIDSENKWTFSDSARNWSLVGGFGALVVMVGACYFVWYRRKGATTRTTVRQLQGKTLGVAVDLEEGPPVKPIARDAAAEEALTAARATVAARRAIHMAASTAGTDGAKSDTPDPEATPPPLWV